MTETTQPSTRTQRRRGLLLLGIVLLIPIVPFVLLGELPGEDWLLAPQSDALMGLVGAGLLAADVLLPIPSTVVGTLMGARLGFYSALGWAWGGLVVGNLLGYLTGRLALERLGVSLPSFQTGLALFATRPIPILAEAVAIAAGAGRVRLRTFVLASVLGNAVFAAALAASGASLVREDWTGIGLVAPMGLPILGWLLAHRLTRPKRETEDQ